MRRLIVLKFEILNPKSEANPKFKIQIFKILTYFANIVKLYLIINENILIIAKKLLDITILYNYILVPTFNMYYRIDK